MSLVVLVITIIVIIILVGVSINFLAGEDGIIQKARYAREKALVSQYRERIEYIPTKAKLQYDDEITLENLKKSFDDNNEKYWVNNTKIISDEGRDKIELTTNDGFIFYITDNAVEYKGKEGNITDITADVISFTPADTSWQVDNVKDALDYLKSN